MTTDCDDKKLMEVMPILRREYDKAVAKHQQFARNSTDAVCVIAEELGELAKEVNDKAANGEWRKRALTEAAHVAVTAIRTIQMLMGEI